MMRFRSMKGRLAGLTSSPALVLLLLFAVTLQVLITPKIHGSPLRVAFSDFVLPIALAAFALQWRRQAMLPRVVVPWFWSGVALLTAWFAVSIVWGYVERGDWSQWALLNKGVGWIVLVGYLIAGAWLGNRASREDLRRFVRTLLLFAVFSTTVSVAMWLAYRNGIDIPHWDGIPDYVRPRGFAQNTNAYAILLVCVAVVALPVLDRYSRRPYLAMLLGVAFCFAMVFLTGSRSAILATLISIAGLLVVRAVRLRTVLLGGCLAALVTTTAVYGTIIADALVPWKTRGSGSDVVYILQRSPLEVGSDRHRASNILSALDLWSEDPVIGIGLGSFFENQVAERQRRPQQGESWQAEPAVLHNTAVWILVETGIIGLVVFAGFFLYVAVRLFRFMRIDDTEPWFASAFGMLLVFMGSSVGTEVLYQRHFWFLMGVLIALRPSAVSPPPSRSRDGGRMPAQPAADEGGT